MDERRSDSGETPTERRRAFARRAPALASAAGLPATAYKSRGFPLPPSMVFLCNDRTLAVLVGEGEEAPAVDAALAYGLAHAGPLDLALVLPAGMASNTASRMAFLAHRITLWSYQGTTVVPHEVVSPAEALRALEGVDLHEGVCHLGERQSWVTALEAWADQHPRLTKAHQAGYRAHACDGLTVLRILRSRDGLLITTGVGCSRPLGKQRGADSWSIAAPLAPSEFDAIRARVEAGVADRSTVDESSYGEQRLGAALVKHARELGWTGRTLMRELPVIRPGGAPGLIDLLRVDGDGALHIIECKVGPDELLVLQGLDDWMWVMANLPAIRQHLGLAPACRVHLDYIAAETNPRRASPDSKVLSPFAPAQLAALKRDILWEVNRIAEWATATPKLTPLGPLRVPGQPHV